MIDVEPMILDELGRLAPLVHVDRNWVGVLDRAERRRRRVLGARRRGYGWRIAVAAGAVVVIGAGVAAAGGVLPWWNRVQTVRSAMDSPFATSSDPAAVPGSTVRLSVPGPESTTFEVVTSTVTLATGQATCTAVVVKNAQGRSRRGLTSCGAAGAAVARAGSFDWQAPSGATYAVITGPTPASTVAKVVLLDTTRVAAATEPVAGGYYLVYAPAERSVGSLVFYDAHGQAVDELALRPHP